MISSMAALRIPVSEGAVVAALAIMMLFGRAFAFVSARYAAHSCWLPSPSVLSGKCLNQNFGFLGGDDGSLRRSCLVIVLLLKRSLRGLLSGQLCFVLARDRFLGSGSVFSAGLQAAGCPVSNGLLLAQAGERRNDDEQEQDDRSGGSDAAVWNPSRKVSAIAGFGGRGIWSRAPGGGSRVASGFEGQRFDDDLIAAFGENPVTPATRSWMALSVSGVGGIDDALRFRAGALPVDVLINQHGNGHAFDAALGNCGMADDAAGLKAMFSVRRERRRLNDAGREVGRGRLDAVPGCPRRRASPARLLGFLELTITDLAGRRFLRFVPRSGNRIRPRRRRGTCRARAAGPSVALILASNSFSIFWRYSSVASEGWSSSAEIALGAAQQIAAHVEYGDRFGSQPFYGARDQMW